MTQPQSPIGKLISLAYQEPALVSNSFLKEKVENLVDLVKIKTQTRGVSHAVESIQNDLFDIRIELIRYLVAHPDLLKQYEKKLLEEVARALYQEGENKELGKTVADVLEVYLKVFAHVAGLVSKDLANEEINVIDFPSLIGLKSLLALQPSKDLENYIRWIEASLKLDYALIVSDLVFYRNYRLSQDVLTELGKLLKESVTDFGAYLVLTNFWRPDEEDEAPLIRNIKILSAALEIENGKSFPIEADTLHHLLAS